MGKNGLLEKKTAWKQYGLVLESAVIILHQQESIGIKKGKTTKQKSNTRKCSFLKRE